MIVRVMMHMVNATLPQPQPEDGIVGPIHTTINVNRRNVGMASSTSHKNPPDPNPASHSEQPQMKGGKGQKGNLHASHLCLSNNAGLPKQDKGTSQYPAWQRSHHNTQCAGCNGLGSQENTGHKKRNKPVRNSETLSAWGKGDSPTPRNEIREITNVIRTHPEKVPRNQEMLHQRAQSEGPVSVCPERTRSMETSLRQYIR